MTEQEKWYAVYDTEGKLVSTGTVIDSDDLQRKGFTYKELSENPTGKIWDGTAFRAVEKPYRGITVYEFKNRFTSEERQSLLKRTHARFGYDWTLHEFFDMLNTMSMEGVRVDPQSSFVQDFLNYCIIARFLSEERAKEIGQR